MNDVHRFEHFQDPTDAWLVWDRALDQPATHAGVVLIELSGSEARSIGSLLNRLHAERSAGCIASGRSRHPAMLRSLQGGRR